MKLLKTLNTDNKIEFIDYWSKLYSYDKEELYDVDSGANLPPVPVKVATHSG
jgi:hypothetical protein